MASETDIDDVMNWAKSLIGTPYVWWTGGSTTDSTAPFYVDVELPSKRYIRRHGTNCAGFVNLLRLFVGKSIPGKGKYHGGTACWYRWCKKKDILHEFDEDEDYPVGTLFIRKYKNKEDQGHLAVLYNKDDLEEDEDGDTDIMDAEIIHAFAGETNKIETSTLRWSHDWEEDGYYEYAVYPDDWLWSD